MVIIHDPRIICPRGHYYTFEIGNYFGVKREANSLRGKITVEERVEKIAQTLEIRINSDEKLYIFMTIRNINLK